MAALGMQLVGSVFGALFQLGFIWAVLIPLELLLPKASQIAAGVRLKGLALSVVWSVLTGASYVVVASLLQLTGLHPLFDWSMTPQTAFGKVLCLIAGTALSLLSFDFLYYWFHRVQHTPLLWRFHAVHHAIEDLSSAGAYGHWLEELSRLPFIAIPTLVLVPVGLPVLPWFALMAFHSNYIHAQTRLHFGPLWWVCMDNRFHRVHHSIELRHINKNFGLTTPLWDWMFRTLQVPAKGEWPATGIAGEPEVDGIVDYLWRPFRGEPAPAPAMID